MKKHVIAVAVLSTLLSGVALAQDFQEGTLLVRARAVKLNSDNGTTGAVTTLGVTINDKWIPEVDFTYFFNKNIAAELILTVPQKHTVYSNGTAIGSLKHLPPTLTVQYHFDAPGFKPYVGAGVNYTRFSSVNLPAGLSVDNNSFGLAVQAGVDVPLTKELSLNFDVKKVQIRTDVSAPGAGKVGEFKVDPVLIGIGLGWKF